MDRELEFPIEKLSDSIDELNLDSRARHMLKRVDINIISQIIITGKSSILTIKNIGPLLTDRIFSAVSEYLNISAESLSSDEIKQLAAAVQEKPFDPLNATITGLDLPNSVILLLKQVGISKIGQLIKFKENEYGHNIRFGIMERRKIERGLRSFLTGLEELAPLEKNVIVQSHKINSPVKIAVNDLNLVLNSLWLKERDWLIVDLRSMHLFTLEEIATEIGGITRERVRQIIDGLYGKIQGKLRFILVFWEFFEGRAKIIKKNLDLKSHGISVKALIAQLKHQISDSSLTASEEDLEKLIWLTRFLVIINKSDTSKILSNDLKGFAFLSCLVDPPIEKYKKVNQFLEREKKKTKKISYKKLAHMVLTDAKKPLHWKDIAEIAYKLNKRENFETRALYHALLLHTDLFVRVGQGTYELAEWGAKQVKPYPDILASILMEEKKAIPFDLISAKVSCIRSIKQATLIMYMEMHPRFYKSINNTYGLRGWLPPREKQNLRTPEWLIEDSKSLERVERAQQRGYDIESIIAEDKLL